jgi:8-oxo-dGTP pyrophosphatase MutT (NUDIX family)
MSRAPLPTWCFALVVVVHDGRLLLVHERKHGGGWYLPAGRIEPGERFVEGALRETLEESGVPIVLDGILRIEHQPGVDWQRLRVVFLGHPAGDPTPRATPNEHSLGAAWFTLDELASLPLRGPEVAAWARAVLRDGAAAAPLALLVDEGTAVPSHAAPR